MHNRVAKINRKEMSTRFAQMLKHAVTTCHPSNANSFKANLHALKILLDSLRMSDINLPSHLYSKTSFQGPNKAPCTFVKIFENENVAINIFILKERYTMPIHNHPRIHGMLKVMVGKLLVESYTANNSEDAVPPRCDDYGTIIMVRKEHPIELIDETNCATLSPDSSQFHRITSVDGYGPGVLFDILTPPYEDDRNCTFYRQVVLFDDKQFQHLGLEHIPTPSHFYCDTAYYQMPETLLDELNRI